MASNEELDSAVRDLDFHVQLNPEATVRHLPTFAELNQFVEDEMSIRWCHQRFY